MDKTKSMTHIIYNSKYLYQDKKQENCQKSLYDGLKAISKTECVSEYGCHNLEEHLSSMLQRM